MPLESTSKNIFDNEVVKSLTVGAASGWAATFLTFPTFVLKTRAQIGAKFTLNPKVLFRGASFMSNVSAATVSLNVLINDSVKRYYFKTETPNFKQSLASAVIAGAGIAPVISMQEFAITLQQNVPVGEKGKNSSATLYNFLKKHGASRGLMGMPAVAMRNTFISTSFLSLTPFLKKQIQPKIKNDFSASILAGVCAGLFASVFAYPLDTLRAKQQAGASAISVKHLALRHLAKDVIRTQGVKGLYAGSPAYFIGLTSYITILAYLNEKFTKAYNNHLRTDAKNQRHDFSFFARTKQNDKSAEVKPENVENKSRPTRN